MASIQRGIRQQYFPKSSKSMNSLRMKEVYFRLLTGMEVDILKDGTLDLPDDLLAEPRGGHREHSPKFQPH